VGPPQWCRKGEERLSAPKTSVTCLRGAGVIKATRRDTWLTDTDQNTGRAAAVTVSRCENADLHRQPDDYLCDVRVGNRLAPDSGTNQFSLRRRYPATNVPDLCRRRHGPR